MNREDLRQFTAGFEAEYPFLKVEVLTGGPQSLLNRILTERRAGKDNFDILNIRSSALYTLKKAGAIARYESPQRRGLRAGFYDKDGYFNGIWASLMVYLFNAKQVSRAQAPKSVEELLQPKWKGKMGMDQDADDYIAALLDYYGDEKGKQILKNLGAQQLNIRKGRTLVSQLVAAGEFPIQIDAHHHEAVALRQAGAPVDYVFPEPFHSGEIRLRFRHVIARSPSTCCCIAGRFYAFQKRSGDRVQAAPVAGVQRARGGRTGRGR
jgi:iron(III) transport system substrate-binding protein